MDSSDKLAAVLQPLGEDVLRPGEELRGVCAASEVKVLSGHVRAVIVTDQRIAIQPVDRRWFAKGDARSFAPGDIASARVTGLGDDWYNTAISLLNDQGVTIRLRTSGGEKIRLNAMAASGKLLGPLSGGDYQREGVEALLVWLSGLSELQ